MRKALLFTEYDFISMKSFEGLKLEIAKHYEPGEQSPTNWVCDLTGKPQLQFLAHAEAISLFAGPTISLGSFSDWALFKSQVGVYVRKLSEGKWYCDHCKKWKLKKRFKHYSFAGIVCEKCYNPNTHRPPDTRGD